MGTWDGRRGLSARWLLVAAASLAVAIGVVTALNAIGLTTIPWWQVPLNLLIVVLLVVLVSLLRGRWAARRRPGRSPGRDVWAALRWPDAERFGRGWRSVWLRAASGRLTYWEYVGGFLAARREPVELEVDHLAPEDRPVGIAEWTLFDPSLRVVDLVLDGQRAEVAAAPDDLGQLRDGLGPTGRSALGGG